jgi:uncharacterized protein YbjT (DUF2867 family)
MNPLKIAIAGANGYVGRHLIPELLFLNHTLTALVRKKNPHNEFPRVLYHYGDLATNEGIDDFLAGADVAYYLVHNLESKNFSELELLCATNFLNAASRAKVKRIIYLSGLGESNNTLSQHLSSRQKVGELFRSSDIESIEFRSSAIVGAGSTSYEIISFLVERLPVMTLPKWVFNLTQPISIVDILYYLKETSNLERNFPQIIEIGGVDVVSYKDMMSLYAKKRKLKRLMVPVPFLSLNVSGLWLHLFTPVHAAVGRHLIASLRNNTKTTDQNFLTLFPHRPMNMEEMLDHAIVEEQKEILSPQIDHLWRFDRSKRIFGSRFGRYMVRRDDILIHSTMEKVFACIGDLGGKNGWYFFTILWKLRALIDSMVGGVGFSKGKSPPPLKKGDTIDCWIVEDLVPDQRLLLASLMKMPGDAHLEFELVKEDQAVLLYQTALFRPKGVFGAAYWYILYPIHIFLFKGLLRAIKRKSEPKIKLSPGEFFKHLFGVRTEETPSYEVFAKEGCMEIRRYAPYFTASVELYADGLDRTRDAFMILARYIFGGNHHATNIAMTAPVLKGSVNETIAMTAPVMLDRKLNDRLIMSFIMPRKYSFKDLPIPDDKNIKIEQTKEQWFAVSTYSGRTNPSKEKKVRSQLLLWLERQKEFKLSKQEPIIAGFDPPWTLAPFRKNELMLLIERG